MATCRRWRGAACVQSRSPCNFTVSPRAPFLPVLFIHLISYFNHNRQFDPKSTATIVIYSAISIIKLITHSTCVPCVTTFSNMAEHAPTPSLHLPDILSIRCSRSTKQNLHSTHACFAGAAPLARTESCMGFTMSLVVGDYYPQTAPPERATEFGRFSRKPNRSINSQKISPSLSQP